MPKRLPPVDQRRAQIERQLIHLRSQLGRKSRADFSTEYRYRAWLKQSHELIDALLDELSAIEYPGEYDQLPVAIVADELGLSLNQIRHLIKLGEIESTGARAHERVSREELARLATTGPEGLTARAAQNVEDIFREAVDCLRAGDIPSAERAYYRIKSRETCIGNHAITVEIAVQLVRGRYEEAGKNIKFVLDEKFGDRGEISLLLSSFLKGTCFKTQEAKDNVLRLVKQLDAEVADVLAGSLYLDDLQLTATFISHIVRMAVGQSVLQNLVPEPPAELFRLLRDGTYTALFAKAHARTSLKCHVLFSSVTLDSPSSWEPARLTENLLDD